MNDIGLAALILLLACMVSFAIGNVVGKDIKEQNVIKMCQKHNVYISSNTIIKCEALVFEK